MNKLTKLLSVFVIAGAIGTGVAGAVGCAPKTPEDGGHRYQYTQLDAEKHTAHCTTEGHESEADKQENHNFENGKCKQCDYVKVEGFVIPADIDGLIVDGVKTETITLSETNKSHTIDKSAIKVYLAKGSTKGTEVPAGNIVLELKDGKGATVTSWENITKGDAYKVNVKLQNATMAEGATANVDDLKTTITVTISNPVKAGSLVVKTGTFSQTAGVDTIKSTWVYEVTRANGDKEAVPAANVSVNDFNTLVAGENKTATLSCTIDGVAVTGTVQYTITADNTKVAQSFAFNFDMFTSEQKAAIVAGEKVTLQAGRFEVMSVGSGSIDNHSPEHNTDANGDLVDGRQFSSRLKTNGTSTASDKNTKAATPRYIKVHADGAGTLTYYAYSNTGNKGDNNTDRSTTVYKTMTVTDGKYAFSDQVGEPVFPKHRLMTRIEVTIPAAGDYYITNVGAMCYVYVQLDQQVSSEGNQAIPLGGSEVYDNLKVSHPSDTDSQKYVPQFKVGDVFNVTGYTATASKKNGLTGIVKEAATVSEGLTYWIGSTELKPGETVITDAMLGDKAVTVKLEDAQTNYTIHVDSSLNGVSGASVTIDVSGVVSSADAKVTLALSNITVAAVGTATTGKTATIKSVGYKTKGSTGEATAITAEAAAELGVGQYDIVVVVTVSDGTNSVDFTVTEEFNVVDATNVKDVKVDLSDVGAMTATSYTELTYLHNSADGKVFITASASNAVVIDSNAKKTHGDLTGASTQRIKLSGNGVAGEDGYQMLGITVAKGATIKVYCFRASSDTTKTLDAAWYDADGNKIKGVTESVAASGNNLTCITLTVEEAGTYYLGTSSDSATQLNIYGVIIDYA